MHVVLSKDETGNRIQLSIRDLETPDAKEKKNAKKLAMLRKKLEAMRNKNLGDKMDEKLWGEKEDVERKEEAMPGDVVGKEVRLFLRVKRTARVGL